MNHHPFIGEITEKIVARVSDQQLKEVATGDVQTNAKIFTMRLGKGFMLLSFACALACFLFSAVFLIVSNNGIEKGHYLIPLTIGILALLLGLFLLFWKCKVTEEKIVTSSLFFCKTIYWKDVKEVKYQSSKKKGESGEALLLYGNKKHPLITFDQWMYGYKNIKNMIKRKRISPRI